jgi:hypothetical protein
VIPAIRITLAALFVAVIGAAAWGLSGLTHHAIIAIDKWADAAPAKGRTDALLSAASTAVSGTASASQASLTQVAAAASNGIGKLAAVGPELGRAVVETAGNINRPCRNQGGPDACGTLAEVGKTMVKVGDAIVSTQIVERQSTPHMTEAMDAFRNASLGLKQNSEDLTAILKDQAIKRSMTNVASLTDSWAGISADARRVADKATSDFLKPVPWYMKPIKKGSEIIDITAAAARHIP